MVWRIKYTPQLSMSIATMEEEIQNTHSIWITEGSDNGDLDN